MTEPTRDAEDYADYTDDHRDKEPVRVDEAADARTPDVADAPADEPPD